MGTDARGERDAMAPLHDRDRVELDAGETAHRRLDLGSSAAPRSRRVALRTHGEAAKRRNGDRAHGSIMGGRRLLMTTLLVALVVYGAGAVLFLLREDDPLRQADAVVVLAGGRSRLPEALALVRDGAAPVLVVSEDLSGKDAALDSVCAGGKVEGAKLVC